MPNAGQPRTNRKRGASEHAGAPKGSLPRFRLACRGAPGFSSHEPGAGRPPYAELRPCHGRPPSSVQRACKRRSTRQPGAPGRSSSWPSSSRRRIRASRRVRDRLQHAEPRQPAALSSGARPAPLPQEPASMTETTTPATRRCESFDKFRRCPRPAAVTYRRRGGLWRFACEQCAAAIQERASAFDRLEVRLL